MVLASVPVGAIAGAVVGLVLGFVVVRTQEGNERRRHGGLSMNDREAVNRLRTAGRSDLPQMAGTPEYGCAIVAVTVLCAVVGGIIGIFL